MDHLDSRKIPRAPLQRRPYPYVYVRFLAVFSALGNLASAQIHEFFGPDVVIPPPGWAAHVHPYYSAPIAAVANPNEPLVAQHLRQGAHLAGVLQHHDGVGPYQGGSGERSHQLGVRNFFVRWGHRDKVKRPSREKGEKKKGQASTYSGRHSIDFKEKGAKHR
jgi:hypothetical protein